ncbi:hypothetical protein COLO4_19584 [Corchorus olitorius]|uniref:Uncharacterized protein n=1 Tax=Corchorus olitorius TaxID=93759 RepID=A0A1R3J4Q3_9ROSI|nr:hypothetical protein COLO4_19584 [Corchorus olitorius]
MALGSMTRAPLPKTWNWVPQKRSYFLIFKTMCMGKNKSSTGQGFDPTMELCGGKREPFGKCPKREEA